jgi:hypothetical protein
MSVHLAGTARPHGLVPKFKWSGLTFAATGFVASGVSRIHPLP